MREATNVFLKSNHGRLGVAGLSHAALMRSSGLPQQRGCALHDPSLISDCFTKINGIIKRLVNARVGTPLRDIDKRVIATLSPEVATENFGKAKTET